MDGDILRRAARHDGETHAAAELVRGIRYTLRPTGAEPREDLPTDAAMLLAMLHERRAVEREQVSEAIGMTRARRAIRTLLDADLAVVAPEAPPPTHEVAASDWYVLSPRTTSSPAGVKRRAHDLASRSRRALAVVYKDGVGVEPNRLPSVS